LAWVCLALAVLLPVAVAAALFWPWPQALLRSLAALTDLPPGALPASSLWLSAGLGMVPVLLMSAALVRAHRCLLAFGRGDCFTTPAVRELRAFAATVLAAGVAGVVVPTLVTLLLSLGQAGPARFGLSLGSHQFFLLLFAALTWRIAAVLARAVALAEENAQFV
jgi:hypothetical protein